MGFSHLEIFLSDCFQFEKFLIFSNVLIFFVLRLLSLLFLFIVQKLIIVILIILFVLFFLLLLIFSFRRSFLNLWIKIAERVGEMKSLEIVIVSMFVVFFEIFERVGLGPSLIRTKHCDVDRFIIQILGRLDSLDDFFDVIFDVWI